MSLDLQTEILEKNSQDLRTRIPFKEFKGSLHKDRLKELTETLYKDQDPCTVSGFSNHSITWIELRSQDLSTRFPEKFRKISTAQTMRGDPNDR